MNLKTDLKPLIATALSRISLAEVFHQHGIALRKQGVDYVACCPFHAEKTPSCHVYTQQNRYYCYGCHAHGDTLTFLMQHDGHSFLDAVETLADLSGVPMPERFLRGAPATGGFGGRAPATQGVRPLSSLRERPAFVAPVPPDPSVIAQCHAVVQEAAQVYQGRLSAPVAQEYLNQRGITPQSVKRFALGYADGTSPVYTGHVKPREGQEDALVSLYETAGVIKQKAPYASSSGVQGVKDAKEWADTFRHRLIFPIRDVDGSFCGMGGRYLPPPYAFGQAQVRPKYINTPETPVYHKSQMLYGLYENQSAIRATGKAVLVEGYLDVIGLHQRGIQNAVAPCGTALTDAQLTLLLEFTSDILLCFDGDAPGQAAARKASEKCLEYLRDTVTIRVVSLPEGMDPHDLMQTPDGPEIFDRLAMHAVPVLDVVMQTLLSKSPVVDRESADRFLSEFGYALEKVPGEANREAWWGAAEALVADYRLGHARLPSPEPVRASPYSSPNDAGKPFAITLEPLPRNPALENRPLPEKLLERALWWLFYLPWETSAPIWSTLPISWLAHSQEESPATRQIVLLLREWFALVKKVKKVEKAENRVSGTGLTWIPASLRTAAVWSILKRVERQEAEHLQVYRNASEEEQKKDLLGIVDKMAKHARQRRLEYLTGASIRDGMEALSEEEQQFIRCAGRC